MGNCRRRDKKLRNGEVKDECNCTYECPRHGICCECIEYHRRLGELPACYFNESDEATFNRSIEFYMRSSSYHG